MENPIVSIVTVTYNHEPFISKTIEGVLMQKVNFPMEFIIAEDHSTDGTLAICKQYAEKYPDLIKLIYSDSNIGAIANERRAMKAARGKYIAFCEGDDYWTDPMKLQKQVDFLESHPAYSVTFHRCRHFNVMDGTWRDDKCGFLFDNQVEGVDVDVDMFFDHWVTQPMTMVYRASCLDLDEMLKYKFYRDTHQIFHLLKNGKGYLFGFYGGVRTVHPTGVASMISQKEYCDVSVPMDGEFYRFNKGERGPKKTYIETLEASIAVYSKIDKAKAFKYSVMLLLVNKKIKRFINNVLMLIKD